jgi:hypothetical protein
MRGITNTTGTEGILPAGFIFTGLPQVNFQTQKN